MGLFRNDRREFEEALEGLLANIGANYRFYEGVGASTAVRDRVAKVKELAARMESKGKASELEAVVVEWCKKQPPPTTFFLGGSSSVADELNRQEALWADVDRDLPPIPGSGPTAEAEEARREEIGKMRAARDYWRAVLSEL